MPKQTKRLNIQRRRVVQGAALTATALALPGLAVAVCGSDNHKLVQSKGSLTESAMLTSDDVSIELFETEVSVRTGLLARVSVKNKSNRSIQLMHISPGAVSTQKGVYQINATLSNNPLAIRPGGTYQFWLTPDDGTQALLSSKPKPAYGDVTRSTTLEVSVRTELDTGPWSGTQRVQALIG